MIEQVTWRGQVIGIENTPNTMNVRIGLEMCPTNEHELLVLSYDHAPSNVILKAFREHLVVEIDRASPKVYHSEMT